MSWGYFADLRCKLSTSAWNTLRKKSIAHFPLAADWSGFKSAELVSAFTPPTGKDTFAKILAWELFSEECLRVEKRRAGNVEFRVALVLDKSQLDMAGYLGALLEGVRAAGGDGSLSLINDGSYVGEDGHTLVVKGGKRTRKKVKDYDALREKLTAEIYPESFEDEEGVSEAPSSPPLDRTLDTATALSEAFGHYEKGENAAALARTVAYFEGGGAMNPDMFRFYAAFLRLAPPTGAALERALSRLLASFSEHPSLRLNSRILEDAVAFLNEHGKAAESVDVVFDAIAQGAAWSTGLAANTLRSATLAKDPARSDRLLTLLRKHPKDEMWKSPSFLENLACLLMTLNDTDGAFAALEQCLARDPNHRAALAEDTELAPLHGDRRWASLIG